MRIYCLREQFKNPNDYSKELKRQSNEILAMLLRALLEAESNVSLIKKTMRILQNFQNRKTKQA